MLARHLALTAKLLAMLLTGLVNAQIYKIKYNALIFIKSSNMNEIHMYPACKN